MSDIKDLLDEAVGSYVPRGDQRAAEERVERRKQKRRLAAGSVAVAAFVLAGWFAWTAFQPGGTKVGSTGSGTYILSDFEVLPHIKRDSVAPGPAEVDPTQADVSFAMRWSSNMYPGVHSCTLQVFDPAGAQIGSVSVEMDSSQKGSLSSMPVAVTGPIEGGGASATGSCGPERLDTPIAYDISDVHLMDDLTVSYVVGWPDGLGEGEYPGTNSCTAALWFKGDLAERYNFTLFAPDGRTADLSFFGERIPLPTRQLEATIACEPFVREDVFPDPKPLTDATVPPAIETVIVPDVIGLSLEEATGQVESLGLTLLVRRTAAEDTPGGWVTSQDPAPGTSVDTEATLLVFVSEGPAQAARVLRMTCPTSGPPEVRTPVVFAQPDGLHVVVDNRSDAEFIHIRQPSRPSMGWSSGSYGLDDEFILPVPPGEAFIGCLANSDSRTLEGPMQPDEAAFEIVEDGTWVSMDLVCRFQESLEFSAADASLETLDSVEAVRGLVPGILPLDRVERAGYAEYRALSFVRIVRTARSSRGPSRSTADKGCGKSKGTPAPAAASDDSTGTRRMAPSPGRRRTPDSLSFSQHPDQHRPQRPVLLASERPEPR
jgi:PASTA domain